MKKIEHIIYKVAFIMVISILVMIAITGLFWQAGYDYADFPYFEGTKIKHIFVVLGTAVFLMLYMYIGQKIHWNLSLLVIIYVGISCLYLFLSSWNPFQT